MQRGAAAQLMPPQQTSFLLCFYLGFILEILPTAALCVTLSDHTSYYVNYARPPLPRLPLNACTTLLGFDAAPGSV